MTAKNNELEHHPLFKQIKRFIIFVTGSTILLVGIILIVLPGPAFIIIPLGLAILATEFLWARSLLKKVKEKVAETINVVKNNKNNKSKS